VTERVDVALLHHTPIAAIWLRREMQKIAALLQKIVKLEGIRIEAHFQGRAFRQADDFVQNRHNIFGSLEAPHVDHCIVGCVHSASCHTRYV
jgi:hypothetical protein